MGEQRNFNLTSQREDSQAATNHLTRNKSKEYI